MQMSAGNEAVRGIFKKNTNCNLTLCQQAQGYEYLPVTGLLLLYTVLYYNIVYLSLSASHEAASIHLFGHSIVHTLE